jgi:lipoprotein-releasing system ATP-binding protein
MNNILQITNLSKNYAHPAGAITVLSDANFSLNKGEIVALVGPSGSGKSTFLQMAGLLDTPDSGQIILQGNNLSTANDKIRTQTRNQKIGFIYQFHHLLPEFSALENVMMPALLAGNLRSNSSLAATQLLQAIGLADRAQHMPNELSGGQQQRVAIARALINRPALLLADEPTGNLDEKSAQQVLQIILQQSREHGMAAIIATHNMEIARQLHRIVTVRDGRIETLS